jgi:predicted small secreted protein
MQNTKRNFSLGVVLAFAIVLLVTACESKNDKKVEEKTVVVKDTIKSTIDTTAVARPRQPGN